MTIQEILTHRIMILDGAMGTMIQQFKLQEKDYRGSRFADISQSVKGNNDLLCLTQQDIIRDIHEAYLEAGADIIETNTFNAQKISLADYHMENLSYEINVAAAEIAKKATAKYNKITPDKPRFVVGAIGPTNKTASMSPHVNDPGYRAVTFDDLVEAYTEQVKGLMDGGIDMLLVETIFDTLNAKAALFAIHEYFDVIGRQIPILVSGTITDQSGRTLSGQTPEAFWNSISHAEPLSVGLNCALGAELMRPYIQELSEVSDCFLSCYPNAGLPNQFGEYDESPEYMAGILKEFGEAGFLNIVGGCCGTTPDHIRCIAEVMANISPRAVPVMEVAAAV